MSKTEEDFHKALEAKKTSILNLTESYSSKIINQGKHEMQAYKELGSDWKINAKERRNKTTK